MIWIVQGLVVGVLIYFMVGGYRAIKARKAEEDRLSAELDKYTKGA